jgi:hypothetical protein
MSERTLVIRTLYLVGGTGTPYADFFQGIPQGALPCPVSLLTILLA